MRLLLATLLATGAVSPLNFTHANGWHEGSARAQACVGVPASRCTQAWSWTSNYAWKGTPLATALASSADGVVISAFVVSEHPVRATQHVVWPAKIDPRQVAGGMEGVPARIGVYQLFASLGNGNEINMVVYFGRAHPTVAQLARANARLASARP